MLRQQLLDFLPVQGFGEFGFAADGGLDDFALAVLQSQDFFLHGVAGDEFVARHDFGLTDAVRNPIYSTAVGLLLYACANAHSSSGGGPRAKSVGGTMARMKRWFQGNF